jgi:serine/threonine protein phosphatase 1
VLGHSPQLAGRILDLGFLVCIDTNCARGGWLTALDTNTGQIWQADLAGRLKTGREAL